MTEPSETIDAHVYERLEVLERVGKGAYGVVWRARDRKTGRFVALKKVFGAFRNPTDAQRTFREVMYLTELSGQHENIIRLLGIIRAANENDLYMIFELLPTDLNAAIKNNILIEIHKRFIVYQTLRALFFLHTADLIHRDLKPANLLLSIDCLVKIADFGLTRSVAEVIPPDDESGSTPTVLTDYVATRWYRAPEIVIGSSHYSKAVDMWAVGCILAELYLGKPLFPGASTKNQLERVMQVTGPPTPADIASMHSPAAAGMLGAILPSPKIALKDVLPMAPPAAVDLIEKCLRFNPEERITAYQALRHPYVAEFHNPAEERPAPYALRIQVDDNKRYSAAEYRDLLYGEIVRRRRDRGVGLPLPTPPGLAAPSGGSEGGGTVSETPSYTTPTAGGSGGEAMADA